MQSWRARDQVVPRSRFGLVITRLTRAAERPMSCHIGRPASTFSHPARLTCTSARSPEPALEQLLGEAVEQAPACRTGRRPGRTAARSGRRTARSPGRSAPSSHTPRPPWSSTPSCTPRSQRLLLHDVRATFVVTVYGTFLHVVPAPACRRPPGLHRADLGRHLLDARLLDHPAAWSPGRTFSTVVRDHLRVVYGTRWTTRLRDALRVTVYGTCWTTCLADHPGRPCTGRRGCRRPLHEHPARAFAVVALERGRRSGSRRRPRSRPAGPRRSCPPSQ